MNFSFINKKDAVAVISCKTKQTLTIDKVYPKSLEDYIDKVCLFSVFCDAKNREKIRDKAIDVGYDKYWSLYFTDSQNNPIPNLDGWFEFVEYLKTLNS